MVLNMVGTVKPPKLLNRMVHRPLTYSFGNDRPNPKIWWGPVPMSPYIPAGLYHNNPLIEAPFSKGSLISIIHFTIPIN